MYGSEQYSDALALHLPQSLRWILWLKENWPYATQSIYGRGSIFHYAMLMPAVFHFSFHLRDNQLIAHEQAWFYTMELIEGVTFLDYTRGGGASDLAHLRAAFPNILEIGRRRIDSEY